MNESRYPKVAVHKLTKEARELKEKKKKPLGCSKLTKRRAQIVT